MAKYRQLYTEFWNDNFVLNLDPEEKFFYIYLLTNPNTSQCGIYELPKKIIQMQTGYEKETINKLLKKFEEYKKIIYSEETNETIILNWAKYNEPNNTNSIKCVNREIKKIKNKDFINMLYKKYVHLGLDVDNLFHEVEYKNTVIDEKINNSSIDNEDNTKNIIDNNSIYDENNFKGIVRGYVGAYNPLVSKEIINNKQKIINKKEEVISNSCCSNKEEVHSNNFMDGKEEIDSNNFMDSKKEREDNIFKNNTCESKSTTIAANDRTNEDILSRGNFKKIKYILSVFESNIHKVVPMEKEKILQWTNKFSSEVIIMAIEEAIGHNIKNIKYIEKILNTWTAKDLTSVEDIKVYKTQWTEKNKKTKSKEKPVDPWDYDQREYDFQDLERKLLG